MAIVRAAGLFNREPADRLIGHLNMLKGDMRRLRRGPAEHSLQTATRAFGDGKDEEYVVCALVHDIGDIPGAWSTPRSAR